MTTQHQKKKYFAIAARRCRERKKAIESNYKKRNDMLENVILPALKRKCLHLQFQLRAEEAVFSKEQLVSMKYSNGNNSLESLYLKEESEFYRECQEEISIFMSSLKQRLNLKTRTFKVKRNLMKLLKRANNFRDTPVEKFRYDDSFTVGCNKISIQSFEDVFATRGGFRKRIRIEVKDIPIGVNKLKSIWKEFDNNDKLISKLLGDCFPGLKERIPECYSEDIIRNDNLRVGLTKTKNTQAYVMYGEGESEDISGNKKVIMLYSLLSDYQADIDDLFIKDPDNIRAHIIEAGQDQYHSNVTAFYEYSQHCRNEFSPFTDLVKLVTLGFDTQFVKLFVQQAIKVNTD